MNDWIKVSDQEPPRMTSILGYDQFYGYVHMCFWDGHLNNNDEPCILPENGDDDVYITHWMLVPAPPEDAQCTEKMGLQNSEDCYL